MFSMFKRVAETVEDEALGEDDGRASPKDHRLQVGM